MQTRKRTRRPTGKLKSRRILRQPIVFRIPMKKIKSEIKCFDVTYGVLAWTTPAMSTASFQYTAGGALLSAAATGGITCLNLVVQGGDVDNRLGTQITTRSLQIKLAGGYDGDSITRVMVVLDKQPNNTALTKVELFQDNTSIFSPTNIGQRDRFRILRDKIFITSVTGTTAWIFNTYIKKIIKSTYSASNGAIEDLSTNALYLIVFSDVTNHVIIPYYNARLRYYDL